ncbi:MAG: hypothetical protein DHS20C02_03620 [Micavibrio sp.]|nr:MAG: hypothetical protein DHS20C02_03620 [Micavibrio sp.]
MPLVAYKDLPAFKRLQQEGRTVLPPDRAAQQDIREMHVGLLNMMPDTALQATERQFFRLVGESNQIAQFYMHPFTLPELPRGTEAKAYIEQYYESFEEIQAQGLDALIISGANVSQPELDKEPFWEPLQNVMDWAWDNVTSTVCSCLATHAVMQFRYGQKRTPRKQGKLWGVYEHRVIDRQHPVTEHMNTLFHAPHSRFNDISQTQFETAGMKILAQSEQAGVHMATSPDGFRLICFQGHPEYDTVSLLKEYKREVSLYTSGERSEYPSLPQNFFNDLSEVILEEYRNQIMSGNTGLEFPEVELTEQLDNTWRDSARSVIANWAGQVYQTTNVDRQKIFMDGVDPDDPLGLKG